MVQVYTGDGKGKTTAAIGQAVRSYGDGLKVCLIQFLKPESSFSGEIKTLKKLGIKIIRFNQVHPMFMKKVTAEKTKKLKKSINSSFDKSVQIIMSNKYDLVILDEINNCIAGKFLDCKRLVELMKRKPGKVELILTGRDASKEIIRESDLVTEMKMIKHPFYMGVKAKKGIEY